MPELITETVLVSEPFKHAGEQYERGDRLPLRHRWVRNLARENPTWFQMEYVAEDVDLEWLDRLDDQGEERYKAVLAAREAEKERRERATRDELKAQDAPQPDLERA